MLVLLLLYTLILKLFIIFENFVYLFEDYFISIRIYCILSILIARFHLCHTLISILCNQFISSLHLVALVIEIH